MRLDALHVQNLRAHADTRLEPAPGVTLLVGPNGAGKTNLLEAIGYLALAKSLLGAADSHVLRRGADHFSVEGTFASSGRRAATRIRVASIPGEGKRAFVNGTPVERLATLVGLVPFVFVSPADAALTAGGPVERRRLLDLTLSVAYPVYLDDLMAYRRALQQRNALLASVRRGGRLAPGTMEAWDEELAVRGARLVGRRRTFVGDLHQHLARAFELLDVDGDPPGLRYQPSAAAPAPEANDADDAEALRVALRQTDRRSRALGRTLAGPHLDEIVFLLGEHEVRPFASQGQHRTFALALRIAQALFLTHHRDEAPLLLFDDVFGTLDAHRTERVLALLTSGVLGQALVTAAQGDHLAARLTETDAVFHVERGMLTRLSPALQLP